MRSQVVALSTTRTTDYKMGFARRPSGSGMVEGDGNSVAPLLPDSITGDAHGIRSRLTVDGGSIPPASTN